MEDTYCTEIKSDTQRGAVNVSKKENIEEALGRLIYKGQLPVLLLISHHLSVKYCL